METKSSRMDIDFRSKCSKKKCKRMRCKIWMSMDEWTLKTFMTQKSWHTSHRGCSPYSKYQSSRHNFCLTHQAPWKWSQLVGFHILFPTLANLWREVVWPQAGFRRVWQQITTLQEVIQEMTWTLRFEACQFEFVHKQLCILAPAIRAFAKTLMHINAH